MHRTTHHLAAAARDYPGCWQELDLLRARTSSRADMAWPSWCWMPMAAHYAYLSRGRELDPRLGLEVGRLAALSTWRVTQGIYRLDETLLTELWCSDIDGALPVDTLMHLPEWCVYVETGDRNVGGSPLAGFYAHLECDAGSARPELRLLLDYSDGALTPVSLHLGTGDGSLRDAMAASFAESSRWAAAHGVELGTLRSDDSAEALRPLLSTLLYICTSGEARPHRPSPTPGRRGAPPRYYPPAKPHIETLGERLGATLRAAALREAQRPAGGLGSPVAPHVRRAHWHTYLLGPRDGARRREVRWLPPIFVGLEGEAAQPVVRHVVQTGERLS